MAVVITTNPAYWADAFFVLPDQPGRPIVFDFRLRFRRLKTAESEELDRRIRIDSERHREQLRALVEGATVPDYTPALSNKELLAAVLVDWEGFADAEGAPVMYTAAACAQLCEDYPGIEAAMARAWMESRSPAQEREAAAKNSGAPSSTT